MDSTVTTPAAMHANLTSPSPSSRLILANKCMFLNSASNVSVCPPLAPKLESWFHISPPPPLFWPSSTPSLGSIARRMVRHRSCTLLNAPLLHSLPQSVFRFSFEHSREFLSFGSHRELNLSHAACEERERNRSPNLFSSSVSLAPPSLVRPQPPQPRPNPAHLLPQTTLSSLHPPPQKES